MNTRRVSSDETPNSTLSNAAEPNGIAEEHEGYVLGAGYAIAGEELVGWTQKGGLTLFRLSGNSIVRPSCTLTNL